MYRQGDIMLVAATMPDGTATRHERLTLALGEVTGHAHVLSGQIEEVTTDLDERFVRVLEEGGLLTHQEHGTIEIPPGEYKFTRQREYAPESTRFVAD